VLLLGVVVSDGTVGYLQPPTRISADFVARAQAEGHPERRFRFSAACREAACRQWTGTGCGVIDVVIGARPDGPPVARPEAGLPACGIRRTCRWYAQQGAASCAVCPRIVADTGGTATWQSLQQAVGGAPPQLAG